MASLHIEQLIPALPQPLIEGLFSATASIQLSAGQTLFGSGDEPDGCYLLKRGVVKVVVSSSQANERIIAVLGPGSFIGELSILDGKPRSASIVAIKDCDLSFATRDAFKAFARKNPDIYEHLTCLLARRLRETDDLLAATSFSTVKARLARALLELAKHLGKEKGVAIEIDHRISQTDLAALAGIARENVARTLAVWKEKKIVSQIEHHYWLNDVPALRHQISADGQ